MLDGELRFSLADTVRGAPAGSFVFCREAPLTASRTSAKSRPGSS
ncbi:MAG: hypothetical protein AVDCRST_MAG17-372 [uncultured Solirubrobacterales bacterium]|uniref:Uncharacterized protein n=1 Tax=uncultured Solirubrobacterales bacterium TaxID=768556 RepID=A0A6J4S285_9ACTN|nr:MAG: hypothetical protein AVDCRST_MAG17-372 [uncultured Solirubrobacterales bacterium]